MPSSRGGRTTVGNGCQGRWRRWCASCSRSASSLSSPVFGEPRTPEVHGNGMVVFLPVSCQHAAASIVEDFRPSTPRCRQQLRRTLPTQAWRAARPSLSVPLRSRLAPSAPVFRPHRRPRCGVGWGYYICWREVSRPTTSHAAGVASRPWTLARGMRIGIHVASGSLLLGWCQEGSLRSRQYRQRHAGPRRGRP